MTREEIFEALESARSLLEDAAAELQGIKIVEGVRTDIFELMTTIGDEMDEINAERQEEYAEMLASMTRDYWKAVV